jgi:TPR repeat protein
LERAEFLLREAAKQEHPEALYVLATFLFDDHTPPNEEVMRLLNLAAQKKYPPAIEMLRHLKN